MLFTKPEQLAHLIDEALQDKKLQSTLVHIVTNIVIEVLKTIDKDKNKSSNQSDRININSN
jgi:hypothetical protein